MNRFISINIFLILLIITLSSCNKTDKPKSLNPNNKINIVCTAFPQYDWTKNILGSKTEDVSLTLLPHNGVDLHNYQPTVDDIVKISTCDLFIYVGGESEKWVSDALSESTNPNMIVINLMDKLGSAVKTEEIIEGMEYNQNFDEDKNNDETETDYDEHVWLSLKNAKIFCDVITETLISLNADNALEYKNNLEEYTKKLSNLNLEYLSTVDKASIKTLIFGDRFPFRYLVDDYNIKYYAAFPGCSAETEASFNTIIFLAEKTDELSIDTIMVTESADLSIAKTIINNTKAKNQKILVLDAIQSVDEENPQGGTTYLSIMENNLSVLKEALN